LGWSTLGLRLPLHVYPEALAPGVLPKLLNHNFGKRPLLDRLFVSIEDQSRRKKHADAPMTAPSNTSGGVTSSVGRPCGAASTAASCATPASTKKGSASRARATAGATANCAAERLVARLGWHWRRAVPPFYRARLRRAVEGVREKPCRKPSSLNKVMSIELIARPPRRSDAHIAEHGFATHSGGTHKDLRPFFRSLRVRAGPSSGRSWPSGASAHSAV